MSDTPESQETVEENPPEVLEEPGQPVPTETTHEPGPVEPASEE